MNKKLTDPQLILQTLLNAKTPVCFIDSRIDYDALCSAITLRNVLRDKFNKTLTLNFEGNIPADWYEKTSEFFTIDGINMNIDINSYDFSAHDLLVCIDTGNIYHIALSYDFTPPLWIDILEIDHHDQAQMYGKYNYVKQYGSACTVLYELLKKWKIKIDKTLANTLITGIIMDTGFLSYSATSEYDLRYAAELIKAGADYYHIIHTLTFNDTEKDLLMRKLSYDNMVISEKHKAVYTVLTKETLKNNNITMKETYVSPADMLSRLKGMDFAFAINELDEPGLYKVSIRSHLESFDSLKLAKTLGQGGGHHMAAGVHIKAKSIDEAIQKVLEVSETLRYPENS